MKLFLLFTLAVFVIRADTDGVSNVFPSLTKSSMKSEKRRSLQLAYLAKYGYIAQGSERDMVDPSSALADFQVEKNFRNLEHRVFFRSSLVFRRLVDSMRRQRG